MSKCLHVKYPLFMSDFNDNSVFSTVFLKKPKCQVSSKSVQWDQSCYMKTDRRA